MDVRVRDFLRDILQEKNEYMMPSISSEKKVFTFYFTMLYSFYASKLALLTQKRNNTFRRSSAVEHSTVNRLVVGSNPTGGAKSRGLSRRVERQIIETNKKHLLRCFLFG